MTLCNSFFHKLYLLSKLCSAPILVLFKGFKNLSEHFQTQWRLAYGGIFLSKISYQSSQIYLTPEKLKHKKIWVFLRNFNPWMIKVKVVLKKDIWKICQNWCFGQFHHSKMEVSLVRVKSEKIGRKFKTEKSIHSYHNRAD